MLIMGGKYLKINDDDNNTMPSLNCKQKTYIIIFYLLLFTPIVLNFVYLFVIGIRLDNFVDSINKTKLLDYLAKTENIVDYVCENEKIC